MEIQGQEVTARQFVEREATATMNTEREEPETTAAMVTEREEPESIVTMITETESEATATMMADTEPETTATMINETERETTATTMTETERETTATMMTETERETTATMITRTDSTSDIETESSNNARNESHWTSDALSIFLHQRKFEEAAEDTQRKYRQLHEEKKAEILKKADQARSCLDSWSEQNKVEFIASSYYDYLENVLMDYCKQSKDMFVSYVSSTRTAMVMFEKDVKIACRSTKQSQKRVEKNSWKIVTVVFVSFLLLVAALSFVLRHEW